jgi:hypothetical protein
MGARAIDAADEDVRRLRACRRSYTKHHDRDGLCWSGGSREDGGAAAMGVVVRGCAAFAPAGAPK